MYEAFYNLKERPFDLTPNPRFIYFTERHCEALANLVYGIRERKGFLVLCGEAGTGKTTLVNALLNTFEKAGILSAFIFNPLLSKREFFKYLLADLDLRSDVADKSEALIKLNGLLLARHRQRQITVLIIDEAQNLSTEILEEVRLLTNLETSTEKLLQIILVGQPELSHKLDSPNLRQLKQRICLRCELEPLTPTETEEYVKTRLQIAGLPDQGIFSDSCIAEIHRGSNGIPRLINTICDNALLTGFASDLNSIGADIIHAVIKDLKLTTTFLYPRNPDATPTSAVVSAPKNGDGAPVNVVPAEVGTPKQPVSVQSRDDSEGFEPFLKFVNNLRHRAR
jgi:general secretion pathway protein A